MYVCVCVCDTIHTLRTSLYPFAVPRAYDRARQEEDRIACENAERRRNSRNASASEDGGSEATGRSVDRTDGGGARSRTDNQRQAVDEPPPYRNEELVRMEEQQRRFEEEQLQRYSSARRQRWVQQQRLFQQQLQHQHRQATIQQQQRGLLAQQLSAAGVRDEMAGVGGRGGDGGMGGADPDTGRSTRSTSRGGHGAVRRDPENDTRRDARGHGIGDDEDAARLASSGDEPVAVANVRDFIPDHLLSESASTATAEMFGVEPGMSIDLEDIMLLEAIWQSLHDTNSNNTTANDADANDASADERNDDETTDETTNVNAVGDATIISSANVASGVRAADDDSDAAVRAQSNEDGDVDAARDEAMTASHIEQADGNDGAGNNNREDTGRPPMDSVDELNDAMISDGGVCATEEEEATHAINIAAASESPPPDAGIAHLTELESVQNLESDIEQMLAGIVDTSTNTTTAVVAPDPTFDAPETLPSVSRSIENEEVLCAFEDRATREDNEEESQSDVTATLVRNIMNTIIERATPDDMTIHEQQGETNEEAHTM